MTSLLSIRPGMIALRVKHAGNPKVTHHASDIVGLVETLSQPIDPDHELRCKALLARSAEGLRAVFAAHRGTDSFGQGGAV